MIWNRFFCRGMIPYRSIPKKMIITLGKLLFWPVSQIDIQCMVFSWRATTYLAYYQESLPYWLVQWGVNLQLCSVSIVPMFQIEPGRGWHHFHLVGPSAPPVVFWESSSHCQLGVGEHLGIWFYWQLLWLKLLYYWSVPGKRQWALKCNSRFWPTWVLTWDIISIC